MGFRITTNMMVNTYKYNLMNNTNKLADARDKVLTQRNFNSYAEDPTGATKAFRLMDKLKRSQENLTEKNVELDARATFLKTNGSRLSDQRLNLNEQVLDLEQVDLAEAITDFSWDQYCYNSALKIGNQLLSQSLIDYMN